MPIITLEVMTASQHQNEDSQAEDQTSVIQEDTVDGKDPDKAGVHFLSETETDIKPILEENEGSKEEKPKYEMLEYMMRYNGTVICKLCGEILRSRTHWYRHKYKHHVQTNKMQASLNPAPLLQCKHCLVFFKSRKGYIGHLAGRHGSSPAQTEATSKETLPDILVKEEPDIEMSIPATSVGNCQTNAAKTVSKSVETKKISKGIKETDNKDWQERRSREEKLVSDIIDRVRREFEAQGTNGGTRKGYTRRTTVMHT